MSWGSIFSPSPGVCPTLSYDTRIPARPTPIGFRALTALLLSKFCLSVPPFGGCPRGGAPLKGGAEHPSRGGWAPTRVVVSHTTAGPQNHGRTSRFKLCLTIRKPQQQPQQKQHKQQQTTSSSSTTKTCCFYSFVFGCW